MWLEQKENATKIVDKSLKKYTAIFCKIVPYKHMLVIDLNVVMYEVFILIYYLLEIWSWSTFRFFSRQKQSWEYLEEHYAKKIFCCKAFLV